jgi:hypothetical protein
MRLGKAQLCCVICTCSRCPFDIIQLEIRDVRAALKYVFSKGLSTSFLYLLYLRLPTHFYSILKTMSIPQRDTDQQ